VLVPAPLGTPVAAVAWEGVHPQCCETVHLLLLVLLLWVVLVVLLLLLV
jgi:hypothetical protein